MLGSVKNNILNALIAVVVAGSLPAVVWLHNAYADDRYIQTTEMLRTEIKQLDHALFEIDQEISFAKTEEEKRKFIARKNYYERAKEEAKSKLKEKEE